MSPDLNVDKEPGFAEKEPDFVLGNRLYYSLPDGLKMVIVGGKEAKDIKMDLTDTPLKIVGFVNPKGGDHHGLLVQVGKKELVVKRTDLSTPAKMTVWLLDNGVRFSSFQKENGELLNYFQRWHGREINGYHRNGWQEDHEAFTVGETVVGDPDGVGLGNNAVPFGSKGTFEEWHANVRPWADKKPGWMFGLLVGLSSAVLSPAGATDGGCYHLGGQTSRGKSDAGWLAASCWGHPNPKHESGIVYEFTSPSLAAPEIIMGGSRDIFVCFDELQKPDPKETKKTEMLYKLAYMLANGQSVPRSRQSGEELTERRKWLINGLTISEYSMDALLGGAALPGGASVRLFDIDAAPLFPESCMVSLEELSQFHKAAQKYYGTAGPELVRRLMDENVEVLFQNARTELYDGDDTRLQRVSSSFAALVVAGRVMGLPVDTVFDVFKQVTDGGELDRRTDDDFQMAKKMLEFINTNMGTPKLPYIRFNDEFESWQEGHAQSNKAGRAYVPDGEDPRVIVYLESSVLKADYVVRSLTATYAYLDKHKVLLPSDQPNGGRTTYVPGTDRRERGVPIDLNALRGFVGDS